MEKAASAPWAIVITGAPACGKGTQCELMVQKYGLVHISTGDLLRARQRDLKDLEKIMKDGKLVPDDLMISVLQERLAEPDCQAGVLLDGFPRTRAQAEMLNGTSLKVRHVVFLDVPDWVVTDRVEGRRIDPVSGRVYHVRHRPPTDEAVRDRLIKRDDDTVRKIRTRLIEFHANIAGVLEMYQDMLITIKAREFAVLHGARIDRNTTSVPVNSNPEQIFDAIRQHIEGDQYWGTSFRTLVSVKEYECGSSATDLLSLCRFFDHGRMRMFRNGCLENTLASGVSCVIRAQAVQLTWPLVAHTKLIVRTSVGQVGTTSVTLVFELTERDTGEEIGLGSCTLVYLDRSRIPTSIPGRTRLKQLVASSGRSENDHPVLHEGRGRGGLVRTLERGPDYTIQERLTTVISGDSWGAEGQGKYPSPLHTWSTLTLFTPADVDGNGSMHTSAIMRRVFDAVYTACLAGELGPASLATAPIRRYAAELSAPVESGMSVRVTLIQTLSASQRPWIRRMVRIGFTLDVVDHGVHAPTQSSGTAAHRVARGIVDLELASESSRL